ncbi:MAG: hypothetical protein RI958_2972 [Actinomycetota bacterium]
MATSSSSSAKKVAKLAQRGKGKKVRFQGGTLFPAVVVGVLVVGLLLIGYSRQSRPDPGSFPPQQGDHWHAAYGMYVCDTWLPSLTGAQEELTTDSAGNQAFVNQDYAATGIHSHDDGVIHWHPNSTKAVGKRAVIGVFLDVYGVELSEDELVLPAEQGGGVYNVDDFTCDGNDVEIKVVAWDNYADTDKGQTYVTDLTSVPVNLDGKVFAIAVVEKGKEISMPPWAADLPELGAVDGGSVPGPVTTDVDSGDTGTPESPTISDTSATETSGG